MKDSSVDEINYTPENAIEQGIQIAQGIEGYIKELNLTSGMLKDVWLREIESLKNRRMPRTVIAVYGATGAGKSSLLNAILEDNIVPTSGMRACTAVVTEISYHDKDTITAEIEFLALSEWRSELEILIHDLVDEKGKLKRISDLRTEAGIAWHKVHAVYPGLKAEDIITKTLDEIIAFDPKVAPVLGTTQPIECTNSEEFGMEIAKYIDSQDPKKSNVRKKQSNGDGSKMALWPLVRLVRVKTKSNALSCGAVLVDLPGVADANLARSSIAKDYMRKCDCIWIVAPIQRAVDDKIAQELLGEAFKTQLMNGNYDANKITFIASKTDDLSAGEVIGALGLSDLPELVDLESRLDSANTGQEEWSAAEEVAAEQVQGTRIQLEKLQLELDDSKDRLKDQPDNSFKLAPTSFQATDNLESRKRKFNANLSMVKRARLGGDLDVANSHDRGDPMDVDDPAEGSSDDVVVEVWRAHIEEKEKAISLLNAQLQQQQRAILDAEKKARECERTVTELQKMKNTICSRKRNASSKEILKEDFRQGLKLLDQEHEEANDPEGFDASDEFRDYSKVDLPVFTCSARDYIRIKGQIKGDGGPSCFTDLEDTEIPRLQEWCHKLTVPARQKSSSSLLEDLVVFLRPIMSLANTVKGLDISERIKLSEKWESDTHMNESGHSLGLTQVEAPALESETPREARYRRRAFRKEQHSQEISLSKMVEEARSLLPPEHRTPLQHNNKGVATQLRQELNLTATGCVEQLKQIFHDKIRLRCKAGATKAESAAVKTSDAFASMHWRTYLATLHRDGEWKERDLNAELAKPMAREIAVPWARVFHSDIDLFATTMQTAKVQINSLLDDLVASAPPGARTRCEAQCQLAREEVELVVNSIAQKINAAMTSEQKIISRCLAPQVKIGLYSAYRLASGEPGGKGSSDRRKEVFRSCIENRSKKIFANCTNALFAELHRAADDVGMLLRLAFSDLSEKVETNVSILWDIPTNNKAEIHKRYEFVEHARSTLYQLELWVAAGKTWATAEDRDSQTYFNED